MSQTRTTSTARLVANRQPIAMYPMSRETKLEIFGYVTENGDQKAIYRMTDTKRVGKALIHRNGYDEPYIRVRDERVFLSDCRKIAH